MATTIYLQLNADHLEELAQVLESRHSTADPLVGKLRALVEYEDPTKEPLDATYEDVKTFEGMIAEEPIMRESAYAHIPAQIQKALESR